MNETPSPESLFLNKLRTETAPEHKALEEEPVSLALQSDAVSNDDYRVYLEKMYRLFAGLEKQVFPVLTEVIKDLDERRKLHELAADLRNAGMSQQEIDTLPAVEFKMNSTADALGIMYVLEGSTMGGRVLYKHVNKQLNKTKDAGAAFFGGYGEKTGSMWKAFLEPFTKYAVEQKSEAAIIEKAGETFLKVKETMATL